MLTCKLIKAVAVAVVTGAAITALGLGAGDEQSKSGPTLEFAKRLVGDWVLVGEDGKPTEEVVSSVRTTAAGTAVLETLFPGSDHEMVTVYYQDGDKLTLTHYCSMGNQPHMVAEAGTDANTVHFHCVGGGNLKSENDAHMHEATITIVDQDHVQSKWVAYRDGKQDHAAEFELVRRGK